MTGLLPPYEDEPPGYAIEYAADADPPRIRLAGEMDLRAASDLREALLTALSDGGGSVLLDMAGLSFIDSTIISVLVMARKRADLNHGVVYLTSVPERIGRILALTGIDSLFALADEAEGADPTA